MSDPELLALRIDLESMLDNDDQYDVVIKVGVDPDFVELRAHSFILRARCSYFKKAFDSHWLKKSADGQYFFKKPNFSVEVFRCILRYLYTGMVNYNQSAEGILVPLLIAADELGLDRLIKEVVDHFMQKPGVLKTIAISTIEKTHRIESLRRLTDACVTILCQSPEIVTSSERFAMMDKSVITSMLKRDDLCMKAAESWDLLLRWVFAHHMTSEQYSGWTREEVKNHIQQDIREHVPLIGFADMSSEDFTSKVYPCKELLPQEMIDNLGRYHKGLYPVDVRWSACAKIDHPDSVLLNRKGFQVLTKSIMNKNDHRGLWNDKKDEDELCKFTLLLRASKDGFGAMKFHQLCDKKGPTLTVAKISNSEQLAGGYNPLQWTSSKTWLVTLDSFIFSMSLNEPASSKIGRIKWHWEMHAVYNGVKFGPYFGDRDFVLYSDPISGKASSKYYESVFLPPKFGIEDYEVFKVDFKR